MQIINKIRSNFDSMEEVWLFLQIFLLITILPLIIKLLTLPQLMKLLTPQKSKFIRKYDLDDIRAKIEKYTLYILCRDFWIYKNICLKRSLVLYHFLRRYGMTVTICFGVRYNNEQHNNMEKEKMEGHAWLLYKGEVILENNPEVIKTYTVTYSYPEMMNKKEKKHV